MKQLIGSSCRITISLNNSNLQYTVQKVLEVTDKHITFLDKFGGIYVYLISNIVQIQDIKQGVEKWQ